MADSNVAVTEGADKKLQTKLNVVGVDNVHAECIYLVAADGTDDPTHKVLAKFADTLINADLDAADEYIELTCTGLGSAGIQITGVWTGTLEFRGTVDGTNWTQTRAVQFGGTLVGGTTVNGLFFAQLGGLLTFRVYATAFAAGTATIYIEGTAATSAITLANALPTGTNTIGSVTLGRTALTAAAPTAVSVGVASTIIIAANANRKGLVLVNTSTAYISLNCVGAAAVLYSGITLNPNGGVWVMDEYTFTTAQIRGIASVAASNIAVQEYT